MWEKIFIGIDPGKTGGLTYCLYSQSGVVVKPCVMPDTLLGISRWFDRIMKGVGGERWPVPIPTYAFIEDVSSSRPRDSAQSMMTFGTNYGALLMALTDRHIPFVKILPRRWQKGLHIRSKKKAETVYKWKTHLLSVAQQTYPDLAIWDDLKKKQFAVADSILIAHYCLFTNWGQNEDD